MKIRQESKLIEILKKYSPENEDYGKDLIELEEKIEKPSIVIPFLGTQGMGKSTLINALFGEDVLPNEADETTCIPVEIKYGEEDISEIYFRNGEKNRIIGDKGALSQYVDNNYNHGNEKNVSHIVLFRPYEILKTGIVIVDLPGVGSLTKNNEETTKKYIEKLSAAFFVISTSPPILLSEAKFIKTVWRGINTAYFVQNVWDDNSKAEISEGLIHNQGVLEGIAKEINVPMTSKVIPVNAYAAAKGACDGNKELLDESNIAELSNVLKDFSKNYSVNTKVNFDKRVLQAIELVINIIEEFSRQSVMTKEEILSELKEERRNFEASTEEIEHIVNDIKNQISKYKREVKSFAKEISLNKTGLLRTELSHLIDNGIVDGERLLNAFHDYQISYGGDACDEAYEKIYQICEKLQYEFEAIEGIMIKENIESPNAETFNKEQSFKWEKGMQTGISVGSTIGGVIAGTKAGAFVGTMIGGPIGTVAGVTIGMAIGILGSLLGGASKKAVTSQRSSETKREIEPYIKKFEKNIEETIISSFETCAANIIKQLNLYVERRNLEIDKINDKIAEKRKAGNDIQMDVDTMTKDMSYLKEWRR